MITGAMPAICLRSGDELLLARRGLEFLRRPAARLGPLDHIDHGQEKQAEVLQLDEVVADLPVLQAIRQRLDVVLKKFDGLYYDEISRILGVHICLTNKVYLRIVSPWKIKSYQYPLSRDHTAERQRCI